MANGFTSCWYKQYFTSHSFVDWNWVTGYDGDTGWSSINYPDKTGCVSHILTTKALGYDHIAKCFSSNFSMATRRWQCSFIACENWEVVTSTIYDYDMNSLRQSYDVTRSSKIWLLTFDDLDLWLFELVPGTPAMENVRTSFSFLRFLVFELKARKRQTQSHRQTGKTNNAAFRL